MNAENSMIRESWGAAAYSPLRMLFPSGYYPNWDNEKWKRKICTLGIEVSWCVQKITDNPQMNSSARYLTDCSIDFPLQTCISIPCDMYYSCLCSSMSSTPQHRHSAIWANNAKEFTLEGSVSCHRYQMCIRSSFCCIVAAQLHSCAGFGQGNAKHEIKSTRTTDV